MDGHEKESVTYERIVGGEGCELTVVCEPGEDGAPAVCHVEERAPYYAANEDLPDDFRAELPPQVQTLYREAFNSAWSQYVMPVKHGLMARHVDKARQAAWTAVKRLYVKQASGWVRRRKR